MKAASRIPNSPANLLTDKRYANFVAAFDFEQYGDQATSRDAALKDTPALYVGKSTVGFIKPSAEYIKTETAYYLANVSKLESIDDLMADKRLLSFALSSYGLDPATEKPEIVRKMLEGGVSDPASPANKLTDKRYAGFVSAFNFMEHGEKATTFAIAQQPSVDKYMRQTLEENAGKDNEGVRLALYFERKAPETDVVLPGACRSGARQGRAHAAVAAGLLCDGRRRQAGAALREQARHRGFLRSRGARQVDDALHQPVGGQQPRRRPRRVWQPCCSAQPAEFGVSTDLLLAMQKLKF